MIGLKYVSMPGPGGYAAAAERYLRGLVRAGVSVTWAPVNPKDAALHAARAARRLRSQAPSDPATIAREPELARLRDRAIDYDTVLIHAVPEYFPEWRAHEPGKRIVGYTAWETDRVPDHWTALLNCVDRLLVPCEWNRDVFAAGGVHVPIDVIPHIAHPGPFPEHRALRPFTFYSIAPWTTRKAPWNALEAYCRAFDADDPVRFVLKTSPEDETRGPVMRRVLGTRAAVRRILRRHDKPPAVELVTDLLSDAQIDALHARGNCYVALGHGEAWLLPAFDAGAFGNAVVTTRFGGVLAYLSDDNAYLLDCPMQAVSDPRAPASYRGSQRWAAPDVDEAARALRAVFEAPDESHQRGAALAASIASRFSEASVTPMLLDALE